VTNGARALRAFAASCTVVALAYFALWGCFAATPAARPMIPMAAVVDEHHTTTRLAVGAGPYFGVGAGLAGFAVAEPFDRVELGASGSVGGGFFAFDAAGSVFGRYRLDITPALSVGLQLSTDVVYVPLSFQSNGRASMRVGGGIGAPVLLRFGTFALYSGVNAGLLYDVVRAWSPEGTPVLYPDVRVPFGLVVGDGNGFLFVEAGASTTPYFLPVPYAWAGLGVRL
jgi:hypothetical protein